MKSLRMFHGGPRIIPGCRSWNDVGAIEIPLRLLIALVVIAVTIPIVFGILGIYSSARLHANVADGVRQVFAAARQAAQGSNGTTITIHVDFGGMSSNMIEWIRIGDELLGDSMSMARYKVIGDQERTLVMGQPQIRLTSAGNVPLVLHAGGYDLYVKHLFTKQGSFVVVDREGTIIAPGTFDTYSRTRHMDSKIVDSCLIFQSSGSHVSLENSRVMNSTWNDALACADNRLLPTQQDLV